MIESKKNLTAEWINPEDAADLSQGDWFETADLYHGDKLIRRGRPPSVNYKISTTISLDADIIASFRAKGPKWQSRINEALREWLKRAG